MVKAWIIQNVIEGSTKRGRWKLTVPLLFLTLMGYGQNYQPINSRSLQVFQQYSDMGFMYSELSLGNMWGTRIDSSHLSLNGDTVFQNYAIYRNTGLEVSGSSCIKPNTPNWNGLNTRVDPFGATWFYNQAGDSIRIHHQAALNEEWVAYVYQNQDSLIARTISVSWVDDGWIADSVKTIEFQRFANGIPVTDPFNVIEFELYKTVGFRKMVDFHRFPLDTLPLQRIDLNSINKYSPGYMVYDTPMAEPSVGDGSTLVTTCQWSLCTFQTIYQSKEIIEVVPNGIDGQLAVTVLSGQQTFFLDYIPLPDSLVVLHSSGKMPKEEGAVYWFKTLSLINESGECVYPVVSASGQNLYWTEIYGGDTCQSRDVSECSFDGFDWFAAYIGFVASTWVADNTFCTEFAQYSTYYDYLKTGAIICGNPVEVGERENSIGTLKLHPNPTANVFRLELPPNAPPLREVILHDLSGREVLRQRDTNEMDATSLQQGIYVVTAINDQGMYRQRLVVQH